MSCLTAQAEWVQSHSHTCSLSKPSSQVQARVLWGGVGEELIFFSGHIFQERFLGDSVETACTYTADKLSSENTGTESMDKCTELHSISCISPEI